MGRKWKRRNKNKHKWNKNRGGDGDGGGGGDDDGGSSNHDNNNRRKKADLSKYGQERNPYEMVEAGNFKLESYYAYVGIHNTRLLSEASADGTEAAAFSTCETYEEKEAERQLWLTSMKSILPASFRIGNDVDETLRDRLIHEMEEFVGKPMELVFEPKGGERLTKKLDLKPEIKIISPAKKLSFVPDAYQLSLDRQTIRRNASLNEFHEWLKIQTHAGFITRQETVSMLPPVILNVKPHHKVLDMCAAPGSKTSQVLEIVNQKPDNGGTHAEPAGCVVANDADNKRAYMLVHQLRRINSPAVLVTNCDAQFFPLYSFKPAEGSEGSALAVVDTATAGAESANCTSTIKTCIEFDRVLCDVPCSGDGTARKNPGVWKKWCQLNAFALHVIQLAIALRGARLTKFNPDDSGDDAGYLCYSTCSMNPIENEAVVAALLRAADNSLEIVNVSLPGLTTRPGMTTWRVLCEDRTKRQIKDQAKKNNPKMIARRKAWEERQNAKLETEAKENGDQGGEATEEKVKAKYDDAGEYAETLCDKNETSTEKTNDQTNPMNVHDKAEINNDVSESKDDEVGEPKAATEIEGPTDMLERALKKKFEPKSFEETELKACCESAGLHEYKSFEEVPENMQRRIRRSCFPPTPEEAVKFHLERCLRVLPQDMDTGGFFVTLLKKVAPITSKAQAKLDELAKELQEAEKEDENDENDVEPKTKRPKVESDDDPTDEEMTDAGAVEIGDEDEDSPADANALSVKPSANTNEDEKEMVRGHVKGLYLRDKEGKVSQNVGKDDFIPVPSDIFDPLIDYYGLSASSFDRNKYRIRACGEAKILYFIGSAVKLFMDQGLQERVTIVNTGLKAFARNNKECKVDYRVTQEGVHFLAPHMTKRKILANQTDFDKCLHTGGLQLKTFSKEFSSKVRELDMGSFVVYLDGYVDDYIRKMMVVMWRCRGDAINCLVTKIEIDGLRSKLRSIFGADEKADDNKTEAKADEDEAEAHVDAKSKEKESEENAETTTKAS